MGAPGQREPLTTSQKSTVGAEGEPRGDVSSGQCKSRAMMARPQIVDKVFLTLSTRRLTLRPVPHVRGSAHIDTI